MHYQNLNTWAHGTIAKPYWDLKLHLWGYLADAELRPLFKEHVSVNLLLCRCPRLISLHSSWTSSIKNVEMWCICCVHMLPGYWALMLIFSILRTSQTNHSYKSSLGTHHLRLSIPSFHASYFQISTLLLQSCSNLRCLQWFGLFFLILYFKHQSFNCLDQFIKLVLFGAKLLSSASISKMCPTKGILWGVEKTTPGMIAAAATLVSILSAYLLLCWPFNIGVS